MGEFRRVGDRDVNLAHSREWRSASSWKTEVAAAGEQVGSVFASLSSLVSQPRPEQ